MILPRILAPQAPDEVNQMLANLAKSLASSKEAVEEVLSTEENLY